MGEVNDMEMSENQVAEIKEILDRIEDKLNEF